MLILHTADWHLGARLVDHDRAEEHQCFLDWLWEEIRTRQVDLLIVAGDIFDSANPPQSALTQYYHFLAKLVSTTTCETLIIGGNHDSVATLNAPREILRSLRVHVHGAAAADPQDALLEYADAVICAVPFLRERDVRLAVAGQTHDEVVAAIREGIKAHYHNVRATAQTIAAGRPIIATGHLTALGVTSASSERQIHIGNLGAVGADCFDGFAYTALGHIHRPQCVAGRAEVRYAGSPIFLAFDEVANPKQVLLLNIAPGQPVGVETLLLPVWRVLLTARCGVAEIMSTLAAAHEAGAVGALPAWVELTITDPLPPPDLDATVRVAAEATHVHVLKIVRTLPAAPVGGSLLTGRELHETTPQEVFLERLRRAEIDPQSAEHTELVGAFNEIMSRLQEVSCA